MLHFMRRFANSWGGKILGVALVVALAAFGVPSILATLDANTITRDGDGTPVFDQNVATNVFSAGPASQSSAPAGPETSVSV